MQNGTRCFPPSSLAQPSTDLRFGGRPLCKEHRVRVLHPDIDENDYVRIERGLAEGSVLSPQSPGTPVDRTVLPKLPVTSFGKFSRHNNTLEFHVSGQSSPKSFAVPVMKMKARAGQDSLILE